ncbi:MAG: hypothetical protein PHO73_03375 [Atribacterota bacterium]|nr:hypothetical protein [Atribacterota bacterium]
MFSIIGFLILPLTSLFLYGYIFQGNIITNGYSWLFLVQIILLIGLLYGINEERKKEIKEKYIFSITDIYNFIAVLVGTFISFIFNNYLGMGPVVAASLVGVIVAVMVPKFAVPAYCGAFVGMASCILFETYGHLTVTGIVAGAVFVLSKNAFNGYGGKLGTAALTGCILSSVFAGKEFLSGSYIPDWDTGKYLVLYSIVAAVISYVVNIRLKHGAVFGSGIVGLLAGLFMPHFYPKIGGSIAIMMITSSFAGMSSQKRLPNEIYVGMAGVLSAFLFIYSIPYFGGTGGKLGTIAFTSSIIIRGFLDLLEYFKKVKT